MVRPKFGRTSVENADKERPLKAKQLAGLVTVSEVRFNQLLLFPCVFYMHTMSSQSQATVDSGTMDAKALTAVESMFHIC